MDLQQARFRTTQWTLVMAAGAPMGADTHRALEELCRQYWYPLYAFIRRRGYDVPEAEDLTQSFFAKLLTDKYKVDASRVKAVGRGWEEPISDKPEENRRVELQWFTLQ